MRIHNRDAALFGVFITLTLSFKLVTAGDSLRLVFFLYGIFYPMLGTAKPFFWGLQILELLEAFRGVTMSLESGFFRSMYHVAVTVSPEYIGLPGFVFFDWLTSPGILQTLAWLTCIYLMYGLESIAGYRLYLKIRRRLEVKI